MFFADVAAEVLLVGEFCFCLFGFCLGILYRFKLDVLLFLSAKSEMQVHTYLGFQINEFPVTFVSHLTGSLLQLQRSFLD